MNSQEIKPIYPKNLGWLEYKLNSKEMDYVWRCIENKKDNCTKDLAGNISASYDLMDRGDWFYTHVLHPLILGYADEFCNLGEKLPTQIKHPYCLGTWWVNYQKQNEFNPVHNHKGVYSFVIWMKIPYDCEKQNKKDIARNSNTPSIGTFQFSYLNILGESNAKSYHLSPKDEGTMLFFPSRLYHMVHPFYDCDEERISVSGNIISDTSRKF
tara:strand:+ start:164 stop:799 length:636 start_codon:yes stop_codon:yes gene_type:complete